MIKSIIKSAQFTLLQFAIAVDQLLNTILLGYADETLSSRAYRAHKALKPFGKFFMPIIDTLFFFQKNHCYKAFLSERTDRQQPPENRS